MGPRGERGDRRRRGEDEGRYGAQPASLPAGADPSPQCTSPGPGPRVRALARRAEAAGPAPGSRARMAGSAPGSRGPGSPRRMLTWALRGPPLRSRSGPRPRGAGGGAGAGPALRRHCGREGAAPPAGPCRWGWAGVRRPAAAFHPRAGSGVGQAVGPFWVWTPSVAESGSPGIHSTPKGLPAGPAPGLNFFPKSYKSSMGLVEKLTNSKIAP